MEHMFNNKDDKNSIEIGGVSLSKDMLEDLFSTVIDMLPPSQKEKFGGDFKNRLLDFIIKMVQIRLNLTEKQKTLASDFLIVGEKDLKYSKLAFENKDYDRSVRYMTTSVESFVLAFGASFLGITEKEAKEINHHVTRTFTSTLYKEPFSKLIDLITETYKDQINVPKENKINKSIDDLWNNGDSQTLDEKQLDVLLNITKNIGDAVNLELNKDDNNQIINLLDTLGFDLSSLLDIPSLLIDLYIISFIAYPHYNSAQHANSQSIRPKDYTSDLGIVKVMPKILEMLSKIDEKLGHLIKDV